MQNNVALCISILTFLVKFCSEEIRKNREKEMLARQELQRQKELEEERRKEINKKKIQEWIAGKKQSSKKSNAKPIDCKYVDSSSEHLNCDADAKYKSWLLKVKKQEEGNEPQFSIIHSTCFTLPYHHSQKKNCEISP